MYIKPFSVNTYSLMIPKLCLYSILLCIFLFFFNDSNSQSPDWQWAKSIGGPSIDEGYSITLDVNGNIYTTGYFLGTSDFDPGPGTFNLTDLSTSGNSAIFISKLDFSGNFLWAKVFTGMGYGLAISITTDALGNVFTTGVFHDTIDFDPGPGIFNLSTTNDDIFISKLDSSGNFIWAKSMGGKFSEWGYSITIDSIGDVFTTGNYSDTVDFDPGPGIFNLVSVSTFGAPDIFISKLDNSGNFLWAKSMGGTNYDAGSSIAIDDNGNIYTTGSFFGTADFDPDTGVFNLSVASGNGIFISKLDGSGNFLWARSFNAPSYGYGQSLAISDSGSIYTTGAFEGVVDFDPDTLGIYNLTSVGDNDIFISKLDKSGNFVWAKSIGGTNEDRGSSITQDSFGNVYITGLYSDTVDFNPDSAVLFNEISAGLTDFFITKFDNAGNFVWVKSIGGTKYDGGHSVVVNAAKGVNVIGYYEKSVTVGNTILTNLDTTGGTYDIFIAKLSCSTLSTINPIACNYYISPSGKYNWTSSGTFMDTILNASGCDSMITINLTINTVDTSLVQNGITLTANVLGAQYQWLDCSNGFAALFDDTNKVFTASVNGNYAVAITQNGCSDTSSCYTVVGVGISEIRSLSNFEVLPNPASTLILIDLKNNFEKSEIEIIDITGKLLYYIQCDKDQKMQISTIGFAKGIYFVQVKSAAFIHTKKLIITE